jgi:hypothetical protein
MTSRAQFLAHIHIPLQTSFAVSPRSSPTKSTYRVCWRDLSEWEDFPSDTQAYWNELDDSEKNAVINVSTDYWENIDEHIADLAPTVSREPHLSTPFSLLYASPHNKATRGASVDHARVTTQVPDNAIGNPDGCLEDNDKRLVGIIEIKSFWNITEASISEVIQGTQFPDTT